jgi:hypothetical protein
MTKMSTNKNFLVKRTQWVQKKWLIITMVHVSCLAQLRVVYPKFYVPYISIKMDASTATKKGVHPTRGGNKLIRSMCAALEQILQHVMWHCAPGRGRESERRLGNFRWRGSGGAAHALSAQKGTQTAPSILSCFIRTREKLQRGKGDQFLVSASAPAADKPKRPPFALSRSLFAHWIIHHSSSVCGALPRLLNISQCLFDEL